MCALLTTESALRDIVHDFTLFTLHSSKPYARLVTNFSSEHCQRVLVDREPGACDYLNHMQDLYAPAYPGPFYIGVSWHNPEDENES